ncbi:MAG: DEAD/DEAH box helicase family protein [Candidatus Omnitrophota bacterium]
MLSENLSEHQTRKKIIDGLLESADWHLNNKAEVVEEFEIIGASASQYKIAQKETAFNPSGFSDYLLLDRAGEPLAVVEAKKTSRDPIAGKQQAEDYAEGIKKAIGTDPFIFLTNGYELWYWNRQYYVPSMVHGFFTRHDLERLRYQNQFKKDPHSISIKPSIIDRDYQIEAVKRVFDGLIKNRRKFLLVMATGTGKTRTAMGLIDVLMRAGWCQRVLFLVDREALAIQAFSDGFKQHLPNESRCYIKSRMVDTSSRLFVGTIQTMMECFHKISPGFFDLIIADECHRSIYNKWKDVLSYFYAIQVGLTATPSDYIERDTFKFFDCFENAPTFNYTYDCAIQNRHLVDFRPPYAAQTNFQIIGIKASELPPSIQKKLIEEGLTLEDINFEGTDLEKKVTNIGTNESLVREFMEFCIKDDSGVLPGKSIIFAISHNHANRLWKVFDRLYPEYKGRLVEIIDSKMERPMKLLAKFKNESYPRVAISVDMLDTGVDIREVVNLVFAKPVFSKIKFWQMIGRGTRTLEKELNKRKPWCMHKDKFLIMDHWNNFEYFGEKPQGELPPVQDAVPVKIFKIRLIKLKIFQDRKDDQHFEKTKVLIIKDIKDLPENSITVRENKRNIDKALSGQIWKDLDRKSLEFLEKMIAPLMRFKSDFNLYEAQFILKTEKTSLAVLQSNAEEIKRNKEAIINDIKLLPRNLSAVRAKEECMNKILSEKFWEDTTIEKCDYIRENLSAIMRHKLLEEREVVKLDLDDLIAERRWIAFGPEGEGDYVENYKEKVEKKVLSIVESHPALNKIKNDIPITEKDLADLEDTLNSPKLYITEENLRKTYRQPYGTFIQFLKFILGKYKFPNPEDMINESFNTYVIERNNTNTLSSEQIRFLRTVKNVFAQKKHIEFEDLFEPPFTQFGADAATRLFSEEELQEVIEIFNSIKI